MKLLFVDHTKCGEPAGYNYYIIPTGISDEDAVMVAFEAQRMHMAALDEFAARDKPEWPGLLAQFLAGHQEMLVRDALEQHAQMLKTYNEWAKQDPAEVRTFDHCMAELGYTPLNIGESEDIVSVGIDWRHNHGKGIKFMTARFMEWNKVA